MATAPMPGVSRREAATQKVTQLLRITNKETGDVVRIAPNNIPLQEKSVVRKQTGGQSYESYMASEGEDSLAVLWWLARRANGEPSLSWAQVQQQWPGQDVFEFEPEELDQVPAEDDSPES